MCQIAVERVLGKLVTDEDFRERFFRNPATASFLAGLVLSKMELDALSQLSVKAIAELSTLLDDRICRLHVDKAGQVPSEEQRNMEMVRPPASSGIGPGGTPARGKEGGGQPQSISGSHT